MQFSTIDPGPIFLTLKLAGFRVVLLLLLVATLDTKVADHEPEFDLTRLQFMDHQLHVLQHSAEVGQLIRLHIHSNDVSAMTSAPDNQTSDLSQ